MRVIQKGLTTICLIGISTSTAQAQMSSAFTDDTSFQARATVTIPFGGHHKSADSKPQLAFGLRSETARANLSDWALRPSSEALEVRELNLALTLEESPTFLLNDQILLSTDRLAAKDDGTEKESKGALDTYDKTVLTVIGVSLAVIAGSIIILSE